VGVQEFLAGLPALLGFTGFVIFQLVQHSGKPNPIVGGIVTKLRNASPERVPDHRLTASAVDRLLQRDDALRHVITDQDFLLLKKVLNQQFVTALIVYIVCAGLFVFGIISYVHELHATTVSDITLASADVPGGGDLVDLDPLTVYWKTQGDPSRMTLYLENIQNGMRSKEFQVASSDRRLTLCPDDYRNALSVREKDGRNRIRVILEAPSKPFRSEEFNLRVGIRLLLVADPQKVTLAAMLDNSLIQNYVYDARVVLPRKHDLDVVSLAGPINSKKDWTVTSPASIDWAQAKMVFLEPAADRPVVRPSFLIDESLGVGPSQFGSLCGG
jgi:hypothetical protein